MSVFFGIVPVFRILPRCLDLLSALEKNMFCNKGSKFSKLRLGLLQQVQYAKLGTLVDVQVPIQLQARCEFVVVVRSTLFISNLNISPPI